MPSSGNSQGLLHGRRHLTGGPCERNDARRSTRARRRMMPAGRRQPLARAISELAKMRLAAEKPDAITIEDALDRLERRTLTRRELLTRGGALGAGLGLAGLTASAAAAAAAPRPGSQRRGRWSEHEPRVVVVG